MAWIECVPNVSEGRRPSVIDGFARTLRDAGAAVLDVTSDAAHNRSVFTVAGHSTTLSGAVLALFDAALPVIDLRHHTGEHPRIGAVDVVPFVPLGTTSMAECVALARSVARTVSDRYCLPVYLYEEAALVPIRRNLSDVRRGGFEALAARLATPEWAPDFGPRRPHPTAGASVVGARRVLIAFNVNLATADLRAAKTIARAVRHSSGGLPSVKAMGVELSDRGIAQVSMNLTDFRTTSIAMAFDAVRREAARLNVPLLESELVGLAPAAALSASIATDIRLRDFSEDCILEHRLRALGIETDA